MKIVVPTNMNIKNKNNNLIQFDFISGNFVYRHRCIDPALLINNIAIQIITIVFDVLDLTSLVMLTFGDFNFYTNKLFGIRIYIVKC